MAHTNERYTNIMRLPIESTPALYAYGKLNISNCKCTFIDGSQYFQKVVANDKTFKFSGESNKLYLDQECTILAPITRNQKIREFKNRGLL